MSSTSAITSNYCCNTICNVPVLKFRNSRIKISGITDRQIQFRNMKFFVILVILCASLLAVLGCPSKFKTSVEEEYVNATIFCLTKLGLTSADLPIPEELNRNADMDDKVSLSINQD